MKLKEFWDKHGSIIETSLNDYLKWFEDGEDNYKEIQQAINDLNKMEDL